MRPPRDAPVAKRSGPPTSKARSFRVAKVARVRARFSLFRGEKDLSFAVGRVFFADMRVELAHKRVIYADKRIFCAEWRGIWEEIREGARGGAKGVAREIKSLY